MRTWDPGPPPEDMPGCCGESISLLAAPVVIRMLAILKAKPPYRYPANPNPWECCGHESIFFIYPAARFVVWWKKRRRRA